MIISMRPHATREEIDYVCERIREFGYKVHSIEGEERVVIGVIEDGRPTPHPAPVRVLGAFFAIPSKPERQLFQKGSASYSRNQLSG